MPGIDHAPSWLDWLTLSLAILGVLLGIFNTWSNIRARRLRVKVTPAFAMTTTGGQGFSIEVLNRSSFPIVVNEVGLTLKDTTQRVTVGRPYFADDGTMPRRLGAREGMIAYFERPADIGFPFGAAYAHLSSGEQVNGSGHAIRQLNRELSKRKRTRAQ
ncbi:hypothetical protein [Methylobacterium sp. CM6247]